GSRGSCGPRLPRGEVLGRSSNREPESGEGLGALGAPPSRGRIDDATPGPWITGPHVDNCAVMVAGQLHILLVEDDPAVAGMYRLKLEMEGYRVTVCRDGEEGLRVAREQHPNLIFLDIRLPRMDGMTVLEAMRGDDRTRHIPVLILTNYGEPPLIERGLRLGAREYLLKSETTPSGVAARARTYTKGGPQADDKKEKAAPKRKAAPRPEPEPA